MSRTVIAAMLTIMVLAYLGAPAQAAGPANPSFESNTDWAISISDPDGKYDAYHSTEWASNGGRSFVFYRGTGTVTAGAYAQISQTGVDLTGVTKFIFDCRDTGIDVVPLRFIVDDNTVVGTWQNNGWPDGQGTGWGNTATTLNVEVPMQTLFAGTHKLTIQMWNPISHYPADPKIYRIDNLRTNVVPEPSGLLALLGGISGIGGLAICRRK